MQHRLAGGAGRAEVAVGKVNQIVPELHRQRAIEPELVANLIIGRLAGMIADDLQHPIDR